MKQAQALEGMKGLGIGTQKVGKKPSKASTKPPKKTKSKEKSK